MVASNNVSGINRPTAEVNPPDDLFLSDRATRTVRTPRRSKWRLRTGRGTVGRPPTEGTGDLVKSVVRFKSIESRTHSGFRVAAAPALEDRQPTKGYRGPDTSTACAPS
ncbi:hypothetical protein EVAR_93908_1 [Eumeta japonica]|uniref:Uncharacterized protein n=1 Tax=Eumeta variegata TaxID=151549 RepID=A0A4C1TP25_EUMVA|nr:hypothetical protein EVAR_93908_1 [Eumeta japonica]